MEKELIQHMLETECLPGLWFGSYDEEIMTRIGWYMYGFVDAFCPNPTTEKASFWKQFTALVVEYLNSSDPSDYSQEWARLIQMYIDNPKEQINAFYNILHEYKRRNL